MTAAAADFFFPIPQSPPLTKGKRLCPAPVVGQPFRFRPLGNDGRNFRACRTSTNSPFRWKRNKPTTFGQFFKKTTSPTANALSDLFVVRRHPPPPGERVGDWRRFFVPTVTHKTYPKVGTSGNDLPFRPIKPEEPPFWLTLPSNF